MQISIIAAIANNRVIGHKYKIPWHIPDDFAHFKSITMGKPIIMGRKTCQSIGKPLPGRDNIVLSGNTNFEPEGFFVTNSINTALDHCKDAPEVMIIGGSLLYEFFLDKATTMYLTLIDKDFDGDTYFPKYSEKDWKEIERIEKTTPGEPPLSYSFLILKRR